MEVRKGQLGILVGKPGTGKSTRFMELVKCNNKPGARNLIVPANEHDTMYDGIKKIKPAYTVITDPRDINQKKKIRAWRTPGINSFRGTRVVDVSVFETDEDSAAWFLSLHQKGKDRQYNVGGLLIDDFPNWIPSKGTLPRAVRETFKSRRHRELDIFLACHGMHEISGDIMAVEPFFWIHATSYQPTKSALDKLPIEKQTELLATMAKVNEIQATATGLKDKKHYYFLPFRVTGDSRRIF